MENVFIVGAQSTGKTTLVDALEKIYSKPTISSPIKHHRPMAPIFIREVARNVLKTHGFTREDITSSPERALQLQKHILQAQQEAEIAAVSQSSNSWYVTDRSAIDPIVYASVFVSETAAEDLFASKPWNDMEGRMRGGLVFLCEAGTRWLVDDGTRLMPTDEEDWMKVDRAFRRLLEARDIAYKIIPRHIQDIDARVSIVTDALLAASSKEG